MRNTKFLLALAGTLLAGTARAAEDRSCWISDAASPSDSTTYLLCQEGALLVSSDGGASWRMRPVDKPGRVRAMAFIDTARGFVVGDGGLLLATADGGETWQPRKTGVRQQLTSIHFAGEAGWAAGYNGVILHTADGGKTWAAQNAGTTQSLEAIYFSDTEHGWAVGWVGTILRTVDGGKTWEQVKSRAASWTLNAVYFRDVNNGWAVGFEGQILHSKDGGATWEAQASPVRSWFTSIAFDRSNRGWIVSNETLLTSVDGGESWKPFAVQDRVFLHRLVAVKNSVWAISPFGVLKDAGAKDSAWIPVTEMVAGKS